ncbi:hypothetical protein GCM10023068_13870 [Leifsonia shinshuensis]
MRSVVRLLHARFQDRAREQADRHVLIRWAREPHGTHAPTAYRQNGGMSAIGPILLTPGTTREAGGSGCGEKATTVTVQSI